MGETGTAVYDEDGFLLPEVIRRIPRGRLMECVIPDGIAVWGCVNDISPGVRGWLILEDHDAFRLNGWILRFGDDRGDGIPFEVYWLLTDRKGKTEEISHGTYDEFFPVDIFRRAEYIILHGWPEWMTT